MRRLKLFIPFACLLIASMLGGAEVWSQVSQTFTTSGTYTVPAGVTSITVEAWGGGGGGGGSSPAATSGGGGGGGGAYARSVLTVTPGATYTVTAGGAGTAGASTGGNGGAGGTSSFGALVSAAGGTGGTGTTTAIPGAQGLGATSATGATTFTGGNGANGTTALSGGGGSSAGNSANGNSASANTAGTAPTGGGAGGGGRVSNGAGGAGGTPGGGGGAGLRLTGTTARAGGAGGAGQVVISYYCPTCYCTPAYTDCSSSDVITNVTIGTLNNTSTCATSGYTDYTGTVPAVAFATSSTNSMSVTVGAGGTEYVGVWIDYNQNGIFESTEFTALGSANGATVTGSISVPAGAMPGNTRMRVRVRYSTALTGTDACIGYTYGETEDYLVTINAPTACAGTPAVAAASGPASACGGSATLTATNLPASGITGITYQWQSRPSGGSAFTSIAGASTVPYTAVQSGATDYQLVVTCSNSGLSSPSNIVSVGAGPQITGTTPGTRCGTGTIMLAATGSAGTTLNWYAASSGGVPLASGASFTTPVISTTTNYYVSAAQTSSVTAGQVSDLAANLSSLGGYGMYFATTSAAVINTVDIYPSTAGTLNVTLLNGSSATISTATFTITAADISTTVKKTLALNFAIPAGATGWSINYDLAINRGGVGTYTYPSTVNGFSITGNTIDGNNISSGSRYYFYNWNVTTVSCESVRTAVAATVTSAPAITVTGGASVCGPTAVTLNATSPNSGYTYTYNPGGLSGASQTVTPASTTTYMVTASDAGSGCVTSGTATVTVNPAAPAITLMPATTTINCGDPATLLSVNGNISSPTVQLGTATTTTAGTGITPYSSNYEGAREQYLIRASELTGLGLSAGNINSLAFNVTASGAGTFPQTNFAIKLAATTTTAFSSAFITPSSFQTVYTNVAGEAAPATGWKIYPFSSAFVWDGTSNILIDICHDNDPTATCASCYSSNSTVQYTATTFNSAYGGYNDNAAACGVVPLSNTGNSTNRPNMQINGTTVIPVTYASAAGLYTDAAATIPYTGTAANSVYAGPGNTITYTATATLGTCTSTATSAFTVNGSSNMLVTATAASTSTLGGTTNYRDASCNLIATVAPSGASPVTGDVSSKAILTGAVQHYAGQPYVSRVYEINPVANAATATATITLYYTQAEFNAYNLDATVTGTPYPLLPTGGVNNGNVRITQYHGANANPYNGTPGASVIITPTVAWNAANSWWAVTFPVTGFSGFILHTVTAAPLSVAVTNIAAHNAGNVNVVNWTTGVESGISAYEVQRSANGRDYSTFATVAAKGSGSYSATDTHATEGINYYRLHIPALNGTESTSRTVTATIGKSSTVSLNAYPNPATDKLVVEVAGGNAAGTISLRDMYGRVVGTQSAANGSATFSVASLAAGVYFAVYTDGATTQTVKVSKQ